ncbi:MAG: hemoblobin-interacting domain-containing protein [Limisphaerales bacterium]
MKLKNIASLAAIFVASLSAAKAQTPISAWTFDNASLGYNANPAPSTGFGSADAVGLGNASNPAIVSLPGSSSGEANSWQFSATGGSDGWQSTAAIGSQGAQFSASTVGYYQLQVSLDVNATANAEGALQVQYTTGDSIWYNANIASVGSGATIYTNTITTNDLVVGTYVTLASGWNNQITVNLSGISQVDDAPNFAIRIVNASTGTNCLDTTGAPYNNSNTTANWTFDNVVIQGVPFNVVADWPFDNLGTKTKPVNNPAPAIANNTATATMMGFNLPNAVFANGVTGSTNYGDITANGAPYSSTGPAGQDVWRLRGQNPGNGWLSTQPIGSQGAEFDVSTINYSNVIVTFDLYETSQGEAKMCVLYTTNDWATTNVANNLSYGLNPTLIQTNTSSPNTVTGTYFDNTYGSIFFNYMVIDFTGDPTVANNPQFAFRIVNAATGFDCVNYLGQPYNNSSGNARVDNVEVSGQFTGSYPPAITNSSTATVDNPFTNTFAADPAWSTNIFAVYVNGVVLTNGSGFKVSPTNIVYTPAKATVLQTSGVDQILILATNFASATVSQFVGTGKAAHLAFSQPAGPSASSGTLTVNPSFAVTDQYGNGTTNTYPNFAVTASVSNSPATWILGGATNQPIVNGYCVFTNLSATVTGSSAVTNAAILFTITGYTNAATLIYSTNFTIGTPPVPFTQGNLAAIQIDTLGNNTTFSVIELQPSTAGQTVPVNIIPISATGTNALRLSSAGSCGKLALSDDGTFLVFDAFQDGSSATPDETFNLNRAVGTLNYTNEFTSPVSYVSTSFGGSQARAACSPDNMNFLIDDKGGLYVDSNLSYAENNVSVRSFGGVAWALTAKVAYPPTASMFEFAGNSPPAIDWEKPGNDGPVITASLTPPADEVAQDFYQVSNGTNYGITYICDQSSGTNGTSGVITKWTLNPSDGSWTDIGSWTNADNCDTMFAATNGSGGVYLYYANGSGGQGGNQLIRLTDQTVTGPLNIISTNVIYTAPANSSIEGVTFVPQQTAYGTELIPPPILTSQSNATAGVTFTITTTPDDATWRSRITGILVYNGSSYSVLPPAAYSTSQAGEIVFNSSQSAVLQSPGTKTIVINATGYSTDTVVQTLAVPSSKLSGVSVNISDSLNFTFTNFTGLSFSVLATNNIAAPVSTWPVIGTATENPPGSGQYQFTDPNPATNSAQYYILRQP